MEWIYQIYYEIDDNAVKHIFLCSFFPTSIILLDLFDAVPNFWHKSDKKCDAFRNEK